MPRIAVSTRASLAFELLQLGEHALPGHRNQPLLQAAVDVLDDRVRFAIAVAQRREHLLLTLATVRQIPVQQRLWIVDDGAVRRENARGRERNDSFERGQVGDEISLET